jgi:transposase-like protein
MAQHFLLSAGARSLSAAKIMRMSDSGVENVFLRLRWPEADGKPVCPDCGCSICYVCRRPTGQLRWRCKACRRDFSITSGTLFAWHKLPLRTYLLAVAGFCNEVKGKSMLAFSRELDVQYKTAFVLAHKLREAIAKRSHGVMSAKPTGRPARRACRSAVRVGWPRSTAPTSAVMSGQRTGRPTGSTGGGLKTGRANAGSWW